MLYWLYWYIDMLPVRSSFHRYCPASPQNSHLQLSGIFFWEPRFPKNQKWKIFSWSGSIASNLIIYKISKEILRTLASNQNAPAKKSLPSSGADMAGNKKEINWIWTRIVHLLNFYQFSNAGFELGVDVLQPAPHLHIVFVTMATGTLIFYNVKLHCNAHIYTTSKMSGSIS